MKEIILSYHIRECTLVNIMPLVGVNVEMHKYEVI